MRWRLPPAERRPPRPSSACAEPGAPVVLVLPARNEAPRIAAVIGRAPGSVPHHPVEVLVIDDGSTDATAAIARRAGAVVVSHAEALGLGAAVRTGLAEARRRRPAAIAFCDADGEYAPEELAAVVAPILAGSADYVGGSRFAGRIRAMAPQRRVGNRVLTAALRWIARTPITDGQTGYRALSPGAAAAAEIVHDYNYAQVLTLDLLGKGYVYTEVPITYACRTSGRSFVRLGPYLRAVVPAIGRELSSGS